MARQEGIRITGLNEKVRDLERLGVAASDLKEAFGEISRDVADESGRIVKVLSGDLRATIKPARTKNKAVIRAGSTKVPYAGVINYGRDGLAGTQFLTGPANANPDQKAQKIQDNLDALIRKYDLN